MEKEVAHERYAGDGESPSRDMYGESTPHRGSVWTRMVDSFRRDPTITATPRGAIGANGKVFDVEGAAQRTAESPLARKLKGRHLQMIAIGGSIGTYLLLIAVCDRGVCTTKLY